MNSKPRRGRPPTIDKTQVLALMADGWSRTDIATRLGVTPQGIGKLLKTAKASLPPEGDDVELVRPARSRTFVPLVPAAPTPATQPVTVIGRQSGGGSGRAAPGPGESEWKGIALASNLRDRHHQIRIMHGPETAREFAKGEASRLVRGGTSIEFLSQQFDLPVSEIRAMVREAQQQALDRINSYDPRQSLAAALDDVDAARQGALSVLNSQSASPAARATARTQLLRIAELEATLAVQISQFKRAANLDGALGEPEGLPVPPRLQRWINQT